MSLPCNFFFGEFVWNGFPNDFKWDVPWHPPTEGHVQAALAASSGTAGPDGWSADEIKFLPSQVVTILHHFFLLWIRVGRIPDQLREAKMANLPKGDKISSNCSLNVGDTRPGSVLSIWWRVFC